MISTTLRVKSEVDGLELKWTVRGGSTGRSKRLKVDGPEIKKWTVQREKTVRSEVMNLDGLKG